MPRSLSNDANLVGSGTWRSLNPSETRGAKFQVLLTELVDIKNLTLRVKVKQKDWNPAT